MVFFFRVYMWVENSFPFWSKGLHQSGAEAVVELMEECCRVRACGRKASRLQSNVKFFKLKLKFQMVQIVYVQWVSHHLSRLNRLDKDEHQRSTGTNTSLIQSKASKAKIQLSNKTSPKLPKHTSSPSLPNTATCTTIPKQPNTLLQRQSHASRSHRC